MWSFLHSRATFFICFFFISYQLSATTGRDHTVAIFVLHSARDKIKTFNLQELRWILRSDCKMFWFLSFKINLVPVMKYFSIWCSYSVASLHASAVESVCGPGQISDVSAALLFRATPSLRVKTLIDRSIFLFSEPAVRRSR